MPHTFFIVDDDKDDQELFKEALFSVDSSIICYSADDGEEALQYLEQKKLQPDFMFVDINLPEMSGWQLLKKIKQANDHKNIPVFIYSTSANKRDKEIAVDLGAICLITKPHDYKLLKGLLTTIISNIDNKHLIKEQLDLLLN